MTRIDRLSVLLAAILSCHLAAAADVAPYRTSQADQRISGVPVAIQQAIFTQPDATIEPLVRWLMQNVNDDFLKVKILHDWVAVNIDYDVESYLGGAAPESSWQATLTRRKAFCQGYAELLRKMCDVAGVSCEIVAGYGRGFAFAIGQTENVRQENHAWNAVKIGPSWYLLDVTWDAGFVEGTSYHKQYGTSYLFPEPRNFLCTHFPSQAKWQLLDKPLSAEEFAALPLLEGRFFQQGLRLTTTLRRLEAVGESVQFSISAPADVLLTAELVPPRKTATGQAQPENFGGRTLVRRGASQINVLVTFPAAGAWGVKLFTKSRRDPGKYWQAATLEFAARAGTQWTFADTYSSVEGVDSYLESPVYAPLLAGKDQEFKIRVHNALQVQLRIGGRTWIPLERSTNDSELYHVTTSIPAGASVQIVALPPHGGNTYWTLVDYAPKRK